MLIVKHVQKVCAVAAVLPCARQGCCARPYCFLPILAAIDLISCAASQCRVLARRRVVAQCAQDCVWQVCSEY